MERAVLRSVKVCYIHQYFSTPHGSGGTRSYHMALQLLRRGHEVVMVCGADERGVRGLPALRRGVAHGFIEGIEVYQFGLPYANRMSLMQRASAFLQFALKSSALALKLEYDLVFATSTPLTAGIPGFLAKRVRRKPFVFEVRDLWPELPRAMGVVRNPLVLAGLSLLERASYGAADACIGLAPGIVRGIGRRSRAALPVELIPNGCDVDFFNPGAEGHFDCPAISVSDFAAVFTGAHGVANGLDAVLDAAAVLRERDRTGIKIVLVGDGSEKDRLRARAERERLDNVVFLDLIPKVKLREVLGRAGCGLQVLANVPAFYDGTSPNKFFDYLAAGLPVLINYPGWLAALTGQHRCGLEVPPGDGRAFADALAFLAAHPKERTEMGQRARRLAETEFSRVLLADRWVDVLENAYSRAGTNAVMSSYC